MTLSNIGSDFNEKTADGIVLVDFYADWCMPCKAMMGTLEEIASEFDERVFVGKVNIEDYGDLATEYKISSIPTLLIFKDGQVADRLIGLKSKSDITTSLSNHL